MGFSELKSLSDHELSRVSVPVAKGAGVVAGACTLSPIWPFGFEAVAAAPTVAYGSHRHVDGVTCHDRRTMSEKGVDCARSTC